MTDPASIALHAIWKAGRHQRWADRANRVGCGPIRPLCHPMAQPDGCERRDRPVDVSEEKPRPCREAGASDCILSNDLASSTRAGRMWSSKRSGLDATINAAVMLARAWRARYLHRPFRVPDVKLDNKTFQHFLRPGDLIARSWNSFWPPLSGPAMDHDTGEVRHRRIAMGIHESRTTSIWRASRDLPGASPPETSTSPRCCSGPKRNDDPKTGVGR